MANPDIIDIKNSIKWPEPEPAIEEVRGSIRAYEKASFWVARDVDAGEYDPAMEALSDKYWQEISDHQIRIGMEDVPYPLFSAAVKFSTGDKFEFGDALLDIKSGMNETEKKETFSVLGSLATDVYHIGTMFIGDNQKSWENLIEPTTKAYSESITSIAFALDAIKREVALPKQLPLRGGGQVKVGTYSLPHALGRLNQLDDTIKTMGAAFWAVRGFNVDGSSQVSRVNHSGRYGMYRIILNKKNEPSRQVLVTARPFAGTSHDPAIEYANREGTQASLGFSMDVGKEYNSPFKEEQIDPISIRIDNEGDTLALDIGSIFGKPGTLGKEVADLIALGDYVRTQHTNEAIRLNHNARPFMDTGFEKPEVFGRIVAGTIEALELAVGKTAANSARQLVLKQTVAS